MRLASLVQVLVVTLFVSVFALSGAFLFVHNASANPATLSLSADPVSITPDGTSTVTITLTPADGETVGDFGVNLTWDSNEVTASYCTSVHGACNVSYGPSTARVNGVNPSGISGTVGTVEFTPVAGFLGTATISVDVTDCDDENADPIICAGTGTPMTVVESTPSPPPPTPTPTAIVSCDPTWNVIVTPVVLEPAFLNGVSGVAPNDVWAVGSSANFSLLMHWDGSTWAIPTTGPRPYPSSLQAVAAVSSDDAWAVGSGAGSQALILRLQQGIWNVVASQSPGTQFNTLTSVTVVSANDVWAVGSSSSSPGDSQALIEHWDGNAWSTVASPGGSYLASVTAISSNDVWAVGTAGNIPQSSTLIEHWDGSTWSIVNSPLPIASFTSELRLSSVSAVSANDIWAIGGFVSSGGPQTLSEHFDGTEWSIVPSPNSAATYDQLRSVAAIAPDDVWGAGISDSKQTSDRTTLIKHWDGHTWSAVTSPNPGSTNNWLLAIAAITPTNVWGVGASDYQTAGASPLAMHFCGQQTTLSGSAAVGATSLQADNTGFEPRDEIVINPRGPNEEYSVISVLGSLDLQAPLEFAHSSGETITRVASGIPPGDANCSLTADAADVLSILRRSASLGPTDHCVAAGNLECHDAVDARDALDLLLYLAGAPPDIGDCPPVVIS